jgi:DNA (cytosine-5)-methyltransferase 1
MAGFRELLAVEWDDNAVATFKLNFPGVPVYHGDIGKLSVAECLERTGLEPGQLDVFDGSPPCQGFSTAGKRDFNDDRNQLFREYVRLLRGLQPRVFVMENVSGMVKGKMKLIFVDILTELKASGYRVSARLLNAMYFGVPQSRQRMIFIGVRDDLGIEPSHPTAETVPVTSGQALIPTDAVLDFSYPRNLVSEWEKTPLFESVSKGFADYKLHPRKPSGTVRKAGAFWHWEKPYPVNQMGYARLASFPDAFKWAGTKVSAHHRVGNSVPPLMMRAIARHIRAEILR